ncbi:MAG TPA: arylesterase [Candidatus Sulfopaludibacter sp.]|nr:arylesterase [Candidatus Sulfopaludibacter sp.]
MRTVYFFALALALCGCKGNDSAVQSRPAPEAPKAAAPPADSRPEIACFGDSLTAGLRLDTGETFPDILQKELDQRGYEYHVVNFGVSGDTTQDALERLPLVLADKPAIVVLEFGANDGLRGQPVELTRQNLAHLIEALRNGGAQVVLAGITLPPNYGPAYIGKFQVIYPDLARQYKLPLIPFLLQGVAGNNSLMQSDGLHPNAAGARIVAATVEKSLLPLLHK